MNQTDNQLSEIDELLDLVVVKMGGDEDESGLAASSTCTSSTCCSVHLL